MDALKAKLEKERDEGFALRDQWLQDSRDQTAEAWATRFLAVSQSHTHNAT